MAYKPNKDAKEYFRVKTVWPTMIYGKPIKKKAKTDSKKK